MTTFWKFLCVSSLVAVIVLGAALITQVRVNRKILCMLEDIKQASVLQQKDIRLLQEELREHGEEVRGIKRSTGIVTAAARTGWRNAERLIMAGVFDEN